MDRLCGFRRHHHAGLLRKALPCGAGDRCTDGRVQLPAGGRSPDPHPGAVSACAAGGADPGAGVGAQHPSALHGGVEQAVPPQHFCAAALCRGQAERGHPADRLRLRKSGQNR